MSVTTVSTVESLASYLGRTFSERLMENVDGRKKVTDPIDKKILTGITMGMAFGAFGLAAAVFNPSFRHVMKDDLEGLEVPTLKGLLKANVVTHHEVINGEEGVATEEMTANATEEVAPKKGKAKTNVVKTDETIQ